MKIDLKNYFSFEGFYEFLKKHYRLVFFMFFLFLLVIYGFIFYQYIWLTLNTEPKLDFKEVSIDEKKLDEFLNTLSLRENKLIRILESKYQDIFNQ